MAKRAREEKQKITVGVDCDARRLYGGIDDAIAYLGEMRDQYRDCEGGVQPSRQIVGVTMTEELREALNRAFDEMRRFKIASWDIHATAMRDAILEIDSIVNYYEDLGGSDDTA